MRTGVPEKVNSHRAVAATAAIGLLFVAAGCSATTDEPSPLAEPDVVASASPTERATTERATTDRATAEATTAETAVPQTDETDETDDTASGPPASEPAAAPSPTEENLEVTVITFSSPDPGGPAAANTGELVEENGCLVVHGGEAGPTLMVFREESDPQWQDGQLTFDGTTYPAGATLTFGGGEFPAADLQIPEECSGLPIWRTYLVTDQIAGPPN